MEVIVRLGLGALFLFSVGFPYGVLYSRGKVGALAGSVVGGLVGAGAGIISAAPDFEPRRASVAAIVMLVVLGVIVMGGSMAAFGRYWRNVRS